MKNEERIIYLQMIEEVIKRMADNSLKMKEWFITISCGVIAAFLASSKPEMLFIISGASIVFRVMDSFYLANERRFRSLYDENCNLNITMDNYSMDVKAYNKNKKNRVLTCLFSWSTVLLYGLFLIASVIAAVILLINNFNVM